jgi:hypothetical protein
MVSILYWAQVYSVDDTLIPVFFFHPTMEVLSFLRQRGNYNIPIQIQGTHGLYDGLHYVSIDNPTTLGRCPPNYNHDKPILAAFLNVPFTLYPTGKQSSFSIAM